MKKGDLVVAPFAFSDGTCRVLPGRPADLLHRPGGNFWDTLPDEGGSGRGDPGPAGRRHPGQAARRGRLGAHPVAADPVRRLRHRLPRRRQGRRQRAHPVTVIGDGAVGLLAVLSAKRLGAEQIILMGRHKAAHRPRPRVRRHRRRRRARRRGHRPGPRTDRRPRHPRRPRGRRTHARLRAGLRRRPPRRHHQPRRRPAVRGRTGRFGSLFGRNIRLAGGPAPVRAYIEELMPDILDGTIEPGQGLRRHHRPRRRPRRLPGHGRPQEPQGPRHVVADLRRPAAALRAFGGRVGDDPPRAHRTSRHRAAE